MNTKPLRFILLPFAMLFIPNCTSSIPQMEEIERFKYITDGTEAWRVDDSLDSRVLPPVDLEPTVPPEPILKVRPQYPAEGEWQTIEGTVFVRATVTSTGIVKHAMVMQSPHHFLNESALYAALAWKFKPALKDGKPVAAWVAIPFKFKISK